MTRPGWRRVAMVCLAVALLSLLFNVTFGPEMSGEWQTYSFIRKTVSKVLSSGTVWAAVSVYAGWVTARPLTSVMAGIVAAEATLLIHYLLGMVFGLYDSTMLSSNSYWFIAGVVLCGPLGLCGWLASRAGWLGLAALLVVPVAAIAEPFVRGTFSHPFPQIPWPERHSDTASGILLIVLGVIAAVVVTQRGPRRLVNRPA